MITVNAFYRRLLDKPDVIGTGRCAICGRPSMNHHHVIKKGMGGVGRKTESRIPLIELCGMGNTGGCHGLAHAGRLHIYWEEGMGGWVYWISPQPMKDFDAWWDFSGEFLPVPGWAMRGGSI